MAKSSATPWWGRFEIPDGCAGRWRIGPLRLSALWRRPEWRIAFDREAEPADDTADVDCPTDSVDAEEPGEVKRVVSRSEAGVVRLTPRMADRPIVARPETTFQILPEARIELFVSTPVWIRAEVGEPPREVLDVPTWQLSDTWFGPTTTQGELCYAVTTSARIHLENLKRAAYRAVTLVRLENRTGEIVALERLSLPAANLSLYSDAGGHLWTQAVDVELKSGESLVDVDLGKGPPETARQPGLVSAPRSGVQKNVLKRVRNALFF